MTQKTILAPAKPAQNHAICGTDVVQETSK